MVCGNHSLALVAAEPHCICSRIHRFDLMNTSNLSMKNTAKTPFTVALLTCQAFSVPHFSSINPQTPNVYKTSKVGENGRRELRGKQTTDELLSVWSGKVPLHSLPPLPPPLFLPPQWFQSSGGKVWMEALGWITFWGTIRSWTPRSARTCFHSVSLHMAACAGCSFRHSFDKEFGSVGTKNVSSSTKSWKLERMRSLPPWRQPFPPVMARVCLHHQMNNPDPPNSPPSCVSVYLSLKSKCPSTRCTWTTTLQQFLREGKGSSGQETTRAS